MGQRREDILQLTSSSIPISFSHWNELLKFFNEYKEQLDLEDLQIIVDKSEEYRLYLNEHSCSHISQHEVNPNVCEYLERLKT